MVSGAELLAQARNICSALTTIKLFPRARDFLGLRGVPLGDLARTGIVNIRSGGHRSRSRFFKAPLLIPVRLTQPARSSLIPLQI